MYIICAHFVLTVPEVAYKLCSVTCCMTSSDQKFATMSRILTIIGRNLLENFCAVERTFALKKNCHDEERTNRRENEQVSEPDNEATSEQTTRGQWSSGAAIKLYSVTCRPMPLDTKSS